MSLPSTFPMKVANGKTINVPSVGFGTWAAGETGWCKDATLAALKAGYRHLDCAWKYGVDSEVGAAIRESGIPRSEIFITSKFWPNFAHPSNVSKCLDLILKNMGLDYIDLYLAHWPVATVAGPNIAHARAGPDATPEELATAVDEETGKDLLDLEHSCRDIAESGGVQGSFLPTWRAMQTLISTGRCRAIGVSNFSIRQLEELLPHHSSPADSDSDIPLSCNQIESHPWLPNTPLLSYMRAHSILATVYSPFAGQSASGHTLLHDPVVRDIAAKNGMGAGQVLQSWAVGRGTVPLGKSQDEGRIRANLAVRRLEDGDARALDGLKVEGEGGRTIDYGGVWGVRFFV